MPLDWLPGATRAPMHEDGFDWTVACPTKGVLHTTESLSWPDYPSQYEPHLTVIPHPGQGVEVRQHIALTKASYALKHPAGTVATNGAHALQMELVGTCDADGPHGAYYWPNADDAVLADLYAKVVKPLGDAFGIPLHALPFLPYPQSYGPTSTRLNGSQWLAYSGWLGHEHVPGNDHGDPGAFPWGRLVQLAQGDDMPLTPDDVATVAKAAADAIAGYPLGHEGISWAIALQRIYNKPPGAAAADIAAVLQPALVAAINALPAGTASLDDATIAKVAQATATELATRLVR